jgi:hypothetical protein
MRTKNLLRIPAAFLLLQLLAPPHVKADESKWPRRIDVKDGTIVIYEPQMESYAGDILESRAAVSVTMKGSKAPKFGAMWFRSRMSTDMDARTVACEEVTVTAAKFPDAKQEDIDRLSRFLEQEIPQWHLVLSLDNLVASVEQLESQKETDKLNNDPPEIIFRSVPSVLVTIDGEPAYGKVPDTDLEYVVNSAFFIVKQKSGQLYLKGGAHWYTASDPTGQWKQAASLPTDVQAVAKKVEEEEKKKKEDEKKAAAERGEEYKDPEHDAAGVVPDIIVRTSPAQLLMTDGDPDLAPIEGTELLYVRNSEDDILVHIPSQQYYVLLAGRWYTSASLSEDNWKFVEGTELPADFKNIPPESDMANIRVSVPGTTEAREAVLENSIPQTAAVDRKTATVKVQYDGDPQFEKCADNGVLYAKNADKAVLLIDGQYYCVDNGIWFVSPKPDGVWSVCDTVPEKVQGIPADCPVSNVKYVYVYDSTPDVVYVGYTGPYVGSYVYNGCVVYGTGYYYTPWYGTYYYPRPVTWGFGVHYNPWTGWGFSFGMSYGWLHIGIGWCRPWYGGWWGPMGYAHGYHHGYWNGYHRGYAHGYAAGYYRGQAHGYGNTQRRTYGRGEQVASRDTRNLYKDHSAGVKTADRARTGQARPSTRPTTPTAGTGSVKSVPAQSKLPNNVYSDKQGNVFREQNNQWQKMDQGKWQTAGSADRQRMQSDSYSRQRSTQRSQQFQSSRSAGGASGGMRGRR